MSPLLIGPIVELGKGLINRFFPDPAQAASAQLELLKMAQNGELAQLAADTDLAKAQLAVNQAEASSGNWFVAGWRPYIGWICGTGLGYQFLVYPILIAFVPEIVPLDTSTLLTLLLGMLGLGGLRTAEKFKGVNR